MSYECYIKIDLFMILKRLNKYPLGFRRRSVCVGGSIADHALVGSMNASPLIAGYAFAVRWRSLADGALLALRFAGFACLPRSNGDPAWGYKSEPNRLDFWSNDDYGFRRTEHNRKPREGMKKKIILVTGASLLLSHGPRMAVRSEPHRGPFLIPPFFLLPS